jgi:hypothetical protein
MKLIIFLCSLLSLFSWSINAQSTAEYTVGTAYKTVNGSKKFFPKDGEILTVKIDGKVVNIQKLNAENLKLISSEEYKVPKGDFIEYVAEASGNYFLYYFVWDKVTKGKKIMRKSIDFKTGKVNDDEKMVLLADGGTPGMAGRFMYYTSYDKTKVLIHYMRRFKLGEETRNDLTCIFVYDPNSEEIWGDELPKLYPERTMELSNFAVDAAGNAYFVSKSYETEGQKHRDYSLNAYRIEKGKTLVDGLKIELKGKFLTSLALHDNNGLITCSGFYSDWDRRDTIAGCFVTNIDASGKAEETQSWIIPATEEAHYSGRVNVDGEGLRKDDWQGFVPREVLKDADGGITLLGEQYFKIVEMRQSSDGKPLKITRYHYNDLLVCKIDAAGVFQWSKRLPKWQHKAFKSYKVIEGKEGRYFVYLDHKKNVTQGIDKRAISLGDGDEGYLTSYYVSNTGEVTRKLIFDSKRLKNKDGKNMAVYKFKRNYIIPTEPGKFVLEYYKKKKEDVLIRVDLE